MCDGGRRGGRREEGRAQTEPLAALVAVTTFALALALFGTDAVTVLEQTDDESLVEDGTIEQVDEGLISRTGPDSTATCAAVRPGLELTAAVSLRCWPVR